MNTKQMFLELTPKGDKKAVKPSYTIQESDLEVDGTKYLSLYKSYMESVDEYDFAIKTFGSLTDWHSLLGTKWFSEGFRNHRGIEAWREDLRQRDQSSAKKVLMLASSEGDVPAAKKLWDMSKPNAPTGRGTFKKAEVLKEVARDKEENEFLSRASARLNVVDFK